MVPCVVRRDSYTRRSVKTWTRVSVFGARWSVLIARRSVLETKYLNPRKRVWSTPKRTWSPQKRASDKARGSVLREGVKKQNKLQKHSNFVRCYSLYIYYFTNINLANRKRVKTHMCWTVAGHCYVTLFFKINILANRGCSFSTRCPATVFSAALYICVKTNSQDVLDTVLHLD